MMKLYSTHCPRCKVLEMKLKQKNIDFEIIDDKDKVIEIGKANGIMSAPLLEINGKIYDFTQAIAEINKQ